MSVTRPTLIFLPSGVDSALPPPPRGLVVAATRHGDEAAETEREDRPGGVLRDAMALRFPPTGSRVLRKRGGSLQAPPVVRRIYDGEKRTPRVASSANAPSNAVRVISQFTLIQAEALARHGVLAADTLEPK